MWTVWARILCLVPNERCFQAPEAYVDCEFCFAFTTSKFFKVYGTFFLLFVFRQAVFYLSSLIKRWRQTNKATELGYHSNWRCFYVFFNHGVVFNSLSIGRVTNWSSIYCKIFLVHGYDVREGFKDEEITHKLRREGGRK